MQEITDVKMENKLQGHVTTSLEDTCYKKNVSKVIHLGLDNDERVETVALMIPGND